MIRVYLLVVFMCILSFDSFAQELSVSEIRSGSKDDVAVQEFPKDLNGKECAALVVKTKEIEGIKFEGNIIGVPLYDKGVYTLFISGAKRVHYKHPDYVAGTIEHTKVFEGSKVYIVELTKTSGSNVVEQDACAIFVKSTPSNLDVYIDGQKMGKTPFTMKDVWAGQYKVEVKNNEGKKHVETVTINEGESKTVNATFSDIINTLLNFNCHLVNRIVIDGIECGESIPLGNILYATPYLDCINEWKKSRFSVELEPGIHTIELEAEGYKREKKEVKVSATNKVFDFELRPDVKTKTINVNGVDISFRLVLHGYTNPITLGYPEHKYPEEKGVEFKYVEYDTNCVSFSIFVNSSKDYYMAETELTRKQWFAVMEGKTNVPNPNKPITNVSYYECKKFIEKLNALTGKVFKLPTLTEWQYACQGGIYKDEDSKMYMNSWTKEDSEGSVHDVAQKTSNSLGLYDMSGNVREICDSWYTPTYHVSTVYNVDNFNGVQEGDYIIAKGYSFLSNPEVVGKEERIYLYYDEASSVSSKISPDERFDDCGIRLVLEE